MNNVNLIGRLTADPDLSYGGGNADVPICKFTLAVDRPTQDKAADFIRIVVFRKQAETAHQYLAKGRQCAVEGRIQTGSYKDREGKTVYTTDVVANRVQFLGAKGSGGQQGQQAIEPVPDAFVNLYDDIPF